MKIPALYLDTSVICGYFDTEWVADTRELWAQPRAGRWRLWNSIVAEREERNAPEEALHLWPIRTPCIVDAIARRLAA